MRLVAVAVHGADADSVTERPMSVVCLHGAGRGPEIEVDGRRPVEYTELPVAGATKSALAVWISISGYESSHSGDEQLVAAARAAAAIARDLPGVAVRFAVQERDGGWLRFEVDRAEH